ncbi:MAG: hypothetical protein H5U32_02700 [Pseudomonas balearica]|uniref:hypothetical protein n=1 Tax=Stutzerimonas balearica TaxID=74829 RepID=UPI0019B48808|nr:hypothetical protein [Stutzerimonas balearica]MBC7198138.1 hypothetical protein [Stutzerimonas balearica]
MEINHTSNYKKRRASAYPSIHDQLDMLWHAMDKGEISVAKEFYEAVKEVKEEFPKKQISSAPVQP